MKSFLSYLNHTADRLPDKLAFADGERELSFRELRQAAASVGACLKNGGAQGEPVGVLMERSAHQIAAFLGVMEAGCFYVPLDEQMPRRAPQSAAFRMTMPEVPTYRSAASMTTAFC